MQGGLGGHWAEGGVHAEVYNVLAFSHVPFVLF